MANGRPNRRTFLKLGAASYTEALAAQRQVRHRSGVSHTGQPNIILIYCDDLGYGDPGCYGSNLATPNLDGMAKQGVLFRQFYSASPVCSPARAALMAGRYPTRTAVPDVLHPSSTGGLSLAETTMADTLKAAGYATMCIGKWHLGTKPEYMPNSRGFDEFFGLPYSNDMSPLPLMENTKVVEEPARLDTLTQRYTEHAVSFIARSRGAPFFLYMPHTFPHIPLAASQQFLGKSGRGLYGDTVAEIDWSVGEVLRALRDNGLDENTLVMFSSDHGPWFEGSTGRLRGRKGETREGGMRVPFLARFPGRIPAGRVSTALATTMDLLPTVARLAGAPLPANPLDGVDVWPLLAGQRDSLDREAFLYFDSWFLQCARLGPWKLHVSRYNTPPWIPLPTGWRKNLPLSHPELYNLESDPEESYDAASDRPDMVAAIRARIDALLPTFPDAVRASWQDTMNASPAYCPSGGWPSAS
jgi:arylsulfatase A